MPNVHTVTTIYNMALDIIVENPVSSPSDNSVYARWLNRNFPHYVQTALREQPWNFAKEFVSLEAGETPAHRWAYLYDLPNGWLRVLPPTYLGVRGGTPVPYEVANNKLYADTGPSLPVEIIFDRQTPGTWDPLFATMIAARLAHGMAHRFTAKTSFVERAKEAAEQAFNIAEQTNAFEGSLEPIEQHEIIRVRGA